MDGEVETPLELTIDDLKSRFEVVTLQLQLECGGNGRAGFNPPASGNQWTVGAVGCASWTGVRYADVLEAAGVKPSAVYTGHYGADAHLSGDPAKVAISRGVPIAKALRAAQPDRVRDERRADPSRERRAAAPGGPGLAGLVLAEVADPGHGCATGSTTARRWAATPTACRATRWRRAPRCRRRTT